MTSNDASGVVYTLPRREPDASPDSHEVRTHAAYAERLAALKGFRFGGAWPGRVEEAALAMAVAGQGPPSGGGAQAVALAERERVYLVPSDTVCGEALRGELGLEGLHDLFGGVVPEAHVATKVITHPLPSPGAMRPPGWSDEFPERVRGVVLPGFSAFSADDAIEAAARLLPAGPVRMKLADGVGGSGQWVVHSIEEARERLVGVDAAAVARGLVVEANLSDVKTRSVGRVVLDDLVVCYHGTQREVRNNHDHLVYGGSRLVAVRGDWQQLLAQALDDSARLACEQALAYDTAVRECFPGSFMSRCNYDVAQGLDAEGRFCSGVLEQSWRVGGATGAELLALKAFKADPRLGEIEVSTTEVYGAQAQVPEGADVYYEGVDANAGPLVKFAQVIVDGNA